MIFFEETENEEMSSQFASWFAWKKKYFYFYFPIEKTHNKIHPRGENDLTSAHSEMLVIPTSFLLFNSLPLLNLGKIGSVGLDQATR